jgi:MbtH protein
VGIREYGRFVKQAVHSEAIRGGSGDTDMTHDSEDRTIYKVVLNHEEQYSIWPAHRENALGWKDAGKTGTKDECLAYIKEVWTDMRPLSLRKKIQE